MSSMILKNKQQGVALITALLIAALVTVAAVSMASRQQLDVRRTGNMLEADQAYMYALAGETLAAQLLRADLRINQIDTLTDIWAQDLPPTIVEGGMISGSVEDMQGRFNLNNLIDAGTGAPDPVQSRILQSLFRQLNFANPKVQLSPFMVNRVIDWIDPNLNSLADGAEDLLYLGIDKTPYRAANRLMVSPSELAAVAGLALRDVFALNPYITALPSSNMPINVNTASDMLLMSLDTNLSARIAKELVGYRIATPFENVADFVRKMQDDYGITLVPALVSVSSEYFLLTSDASIGRTKLRMYSLLARRGGTITVLSRGIGSI